MALVPYTVQTLARSDSEGTGGNTNIVVGAVITAVGSTGAQATMYDDALMTNPNTTKTTSADGNREVWLEEDVYTFTVNGKSSKVDLTRFGGTATQLINSTRDYTAGDIVQVSGFSTPGVGAATWRYTGTSGLTPSQTPADRGAAELTDASGRLWELVVESSEIDLFQIGHVYEENTGSSAPSGDSTALLQAAHDHLSSSGGGSVILPGGMIGFSSTLYFGEGDAVMFKGKGRGIVSNGKSVFRGSAGTRMVWIGAAGVDGIVFTSDRGNTGTKDMTEGGGIVDVMIDGSESGGKGVSVISHCGQVIKVQLCYWTDIGFYTNCLTNGNTNGPSDNQRFVWNIHTGDTNTSSEPNAHIVLHGTGGANTSLGTVEEFKVQAESAAVAIDFCDIDGTFIEGMWTGTRSAPSGDGGKVIFHSTSSQPAYAGTQAGNARHITVKSCQCTQGVVSKGGTGPSVDNYILSLSRGNGAPVPAVEVGATLYWATDGGVASLSGLQSAAFGANDNQVKIARDAMGGESVRLFSGSSNHAVWMGANSIGDWAQNINNTNGDLRLIRLSGTGSLELDRKLKLINQTKLASAPGAASDALRITIDGTDYWIALTPV